MQNSNIVFNLTYLGVTDLAFASSAPPKTQVKTALAGPFGQRTNLNNSFTRDKHEPPYWRCILMSLTVHVCIEYYMH